jgi:hypothetical protein
MVRINSNVVGYFSFATSAKTSPSNNVEKRVIIAKATGSTGRLNVWQVFTRLLTYLVISPALRRN